MQAILSDFSNEDYAYNKIPVSKGFQYHNNLLLVTSETRVFMIKDKISHTHVKYKPIS